jgi:NAD(P)-dependent dehydrogenase (short-subunit alcohol dehydrogenase family)
VQVNGSGVVVVGGIASGLGTAVANHLARAGAHVLVVVPEVEGATLDLGNQLDADVIHLRADPNDEDAMSDALDRAEARARLRIVVSCAGISRPQRTLSVRGPHSLDDFADVLRANVVGPFNVVRLAAERMARNDALDGDRGVVVLMSSVAAFEGQVGQVAYAASKGALAAMALPMARDLARQEIRAVAIAPGFLETRQVATMPADRREAMAASVPHPPRLGAPGELALLVESVITNPYINGTTLRLDGGVRFPSG